MSNPTDSRVTVARAIHTEYAATTYAGMDRGDLLYACGRLESGLDMALSVIDEAALVAMLRQMADLTDAVVRMESGDEGTQGPVTTDDGLCSPCRDGSHRCDGCGCDCDRAKMQRREL